jgi:hypothetical protein
MKSKHKLMKRIFESQGMQVNFDSFDENVEEEIVQEYGAAKATDRINFHKMDDKHLKAVGGENSFGGKLLYNWYNTSLGHLYNSVKGAFGDSWQEKVRDYGKANGFSDELLLRLGAGAGEGDRLDLKDDRTKEGERLAQLFNSVVSDLAKMGGVRYAEDALQLMAKDGPTDYIPFGSIINALNATAKAQQDEEDRKAVSAAMEGVMTVNDIWRNIVSDAGMKAGLVHESDSNKKV